MRKPPGHRPYQSDYDQSRPQDSGESDIKSLLLRTGFETEETIRSHTRWGSRKERGLRRDPAGFQSQLHHIKMHELGQVTWYHRASLPSPAVNAFNNQLFNSNCVPGMVLCTRIGASGKWHGRQGDRRKVFINNHCNKFTVTNCFMCHNGRPQDHLEGLVTRGA